MDGIICIDKPQGFTSFDVIAKMRGILQTRKIGHAGTLDPMATGVLPVFVGSATKCCDILPCQDKQYKAGFCFGKISDTQDAFGAVQPVENAQPVGRPQVEDALCMLRGEILQLPPMYSAIQVNGQRLYDLARKGVEIEREKRKVTVYQNELLAFDEQTQSGQLRILCSKGTYVRTICHDLGQILGCGAIMTSLRREMASGFGLDKAFTLEQLQRLRDENRLEEAFIPIEQAFVSYGAAYLSAQQARMFRNGVKLTLSRVKIKGESPIVRVYDGQGKFFALAKRLEDEDILRSFRTFVREETDLA